MTGLPYVEHLYIIRSSLCMEYARDAIMKPHLRSRARRTDTSRSKLKLRTAEARRKNHRKRIAIILMVVAQTVAFGMFFAGFIDLYIALVIAAALFLGTGYYVFKCNP